MYLSIVFMLSILLWIIYLYIYYIRDVYIYILYIIGFLSWRIFLGLSDWGLIFHIESRGGMFRITLKLSGFYASYSSLGETRLCSKECSIVKQRFCVILRLFLEHFRLLFAVLHHHFL